MQARNTELDLRISTLTEKLDKLLKQELSHRKSKLSNVTSDQTLLHAALAEAYLERAKLSDLKEAVFQYEAAIQTIDSQKIEKWTRYAELTINYYINKLRAKVLLAKQDTVNGKSLAEEVINYINSNKKDNNSLHLNDVFPFLSKEQQDHVENELANLIKDCEQISEKQKTDTNNNNSCINNASDKKELSVTSAKGFKLFHLWLDKSAEKQSEPELSELNKEEALPHLRNQFVFTLNLWKPRKREELAQLLFAIANAHFTQAKELSLEKKQLFVETTQTLYEKSLALATNSSAKEELDEFRKNNALVFSKERHPDNAEQRNQHYQNLITMNADSFFKSTIKTYFETLPQFSSHVIDKISIAILEKLSNQEFKVSTDENLNANIVSLFTNAKKKFFSEEEYKLNKKPINISNKI